MPGAHLPQYSNQENNKRAGARGQIHFYVGTKAESIEKIGFKARSINPMHLSSLDEVFLLPSNSHVFVTFSALDLTMETGDMPVAGLSASSVRPGSPHLNSHEILDLEGERPAPKSFPLPPSGILDR